jgi:1-acyl-sn-glycerol-3-phosphate acyltransferase
MSSAQRLFKLWRVAATGLSFLIFGLGSLVLGLLLLVLLVPVPVSRHNKQTLTRTAVRRAARCYLGTLKLLGLITFDIDYEQALGNSGQLIIANHPTLLDAIFLMAYLPNPNCVVKSAMANNPLTWALISLGGYISNQQNGMDLLEQAVTLLHEGQNLLIFPEGTRTDDGQQLRFKRGAANIALRAACPIRPVIIDCQPLTLRKHQAWYQVPDRAPHFHLRVLKPLQVNQCIDVTRPEGIQARHLTRFWLNLFTEQLQVQG